MSVKNSFASFAEQMQLFSNNILSIYASLNDIVKSEDSEIEVPISQDQNAYLPAVGYLKSEIDRLSQYMNTLSSVDKRGSVVQTAKNEFHRIILADLNREPNPISELSEVTNFRAESNWFFDSLLNPILKIRIPLEGKIENSSRKVLSRRYIITFNRNEDGTYTDQALSAINLFNSDFKNRTDITTAELEDWINNTPGISLSKQGNRINYDEQVFELEPNKVQFEGFFTILSAFEDTTNKKQFYKIDTLDYYDTITSEKKQLQVGDELILNTELATTRYRIAEIVNDASEYMVRFEITEGFEPIPVGIVSGMKYYSDYTVNKNVDISIGFDEYNVVFLKAINTDNSIEGRKWSRGVAYFSNDLELFSDDNTGNNGRSMTEFYVNTVRDFGSVLKDMVERQIPRKYGLTPNAPLLSSENFRVKQVNTYLTETSNVKEQRAKHKQIRELRSKLDETSKVIQEKQRELNGKTFKNPKDRQDVENQISRLKEQADSDTQLLNTTVNEILTLSQSDTTVDPEYMVQGIFDIPSAIDNGKTKPQNVIAFKIQYKSSNTDGKEEENDIFKVLDANGDEINAVFSPWKQRITDIRERVFDAQEQSFIWADEDLSSIDEPNINSVRIPIRPNERITIRVKSISEVGYPDSLLESEWSNEITISFPDELLEGNDPRQQFQKNAELEDLRNRVSSDLDRKGLSQHLSDASTFEDTYFPHMLSNVGYKDAQGKIISANDKIKQIEASDPVERNKLISLRSPWKSYGGDYSNPEYYKHEGRVFLQGLVRIDRGSSFTDPTERFPNDLIKIYGDDISNQDISVIGILPENYRPTTRRILQVLSAGEGNGTHISGRVDVLPTGEIIAVYVNTSWISLDGLSVRVE